MDLWSPPHDAPHLLEWWRPLMLVSRRARVDRFPWPVHLDEFRLAGRVKRQGRPDIWIYDHHENGGSVCVDATGQTYKFIATPRAKGVGQFRPCEVRTALWRARLPDVVEPMTYDEPRRAGWDESDPAAHVAHADTAPAAGWADGVGPVDDDLGEGLDDDDVGADDARVVRRGHLTLVAG
jgi:hypothetical protein